MHALYEAACTQFGGMPHVWRTLSRGTPVTRLQLLLMY